MPTAHRVQWRRRDAKSTQHSPSEEALDAYARYTAARLNLILDLADLRLAIETRAKSATIRYHRRCLAKTIHELIAARIDLGGLEAGKPESTVRGSAETQAGDEAPETLRGPSEAPEAPQ